MAPVPSGFASPVGTVTPESDTAFGGILDALVQEQVQFSIDKGVTSVGIVSDSVPTWAWFVEGLGSLKWIVSPRDIPGRMEGDPPWFTKYESISGRREVEVVLVQGAWECVPEQV